MDRIPQFYKGPLGLPFYWQHETSGELESAVKAYLDNRIDGMTIRDEQISLLREYLAHYINAPCWSNSEFACELEDEFVSKLKELRAAAPGLRTPGEIGEWIAKCLDIGLDPL
jgi:hypothetical protein